MKFEYYFLLIGGFVFSGFLVYSIYLQNETMLIIACFTYLVYVVTFFILTNVRDNRRIEKI